MRRQMPQFDLVFSTECDRGLPSSSSPSSSCAPSVEDDSVTFQRGLSEEKANSSLTENVGASTLVDSTGLADRRVVYADWVMYFSDGTEQEILCTGAASALALGNLIAERMRTELERVEPKQ